MRQSQLFTKVLRAVSKDEVALNAQLLERGGFVYKNSAGVYSFLPLGWRVMQNIAKIVREEINAIGGQEMQMPALVDKKYMDATGRSDVEIGFDIYGKADKKPSFVLGWTHEEIITAIASKYISSYRDLPFAAYQIQTKFRNEPRAKSGLLRGREFMMKDLYSFHASDEDFLRYYEKVADTYQRIFKRCDLKAVYTVAAGGSFTSGYTHEFQVVSATGEDTIFVCSKNDYAENEEVTKLKEGDTCPKCSGSIYRKKSIEVGNVFPLGTKYSKAFNLKFSDEKGKENFVVMGSYGIGLGRLMATVVEVSNDKDGIIWPDSIAPFEAHLLAINGADGNKVYESLQKAGVEVLYDDRDFSAGEKFAEADLLGIPWRLVVSPKTGDKVEAKKRNEKGARILSPAETIKLFD